MVSIIRRYDDDAGVPVVVAWPILTRSSWSLANRVTRSTCSPAGPFCACFYRAGA